MKWSSTRSLCMHVGGMILAQFESDIPLNQTIHLRYYAIYIGHTSVKIH